MIDSEILLIKGLNEGKCLSFIGLCIKCSPRLYCFLYDLLKSRDAAEDIARDLNILVKMIEYHITKAMKYLKVFFLLIYYFKKT